MIRRALTVAGREVRSYFDHATAYILLVIFLAVNFFFFFREAYLVAEGSLRPMFGMMPWLLLFFVPAVTMRALAEERRAGTLELVLAQPVSELEFLLGKFLGVMAFMGIALAGTLGVPIGLSLGADLQWGVIVAQYVGTVLLLSGLVSIGLWTSSLTRNQVTAFILGVAVIFLFYLLGLQVVLLSLPAGLRTVAERLGVLGHYENISRGVIDLRDVLYFVALTAAFGALSYHSLLRDRLSRERPAYRRLLGGTVGLVAIAVFVGLLGAELRGRLDLTPGNAYTLSDATRQVVGELDDLVTVEFFTSEELPPEFASVKRDAEDLLRDYDAAGGDELRVVRRVPEGENEARQAADRLGIPPIEFNVLGEEEFQVRRGYLGLAVQYAGETGAIPVIQQTADLEYRLTSTIRSLTRDERPSLAFLRGHGEHDLFRNLRAVGERLRDDYSVDALTLDSATTQVPDTVDVVVVAGPQQPLPPQEVAALEAFADRGGSLFLLLSGVRIDQQSRFAMPGADPGLGRLLERWGVRLVEGLAYDLRLNARVSVRGEGGMTYLLQYPLWPFVRPASPHVVARELGSVLVPWVSPLELTAAADSDAVAPLLSTSEFGGVIAEPTSVEATRDWSGLAADPSALGPRVVAAALLPRGMAAEDTNETDDDEEAPDAGEQGAEGASRPRGEGALRAAGLGGLLGLRPVPAAAAPQETDPAAADTAAATAPQEVDSPTAAPPQEADTSAGPVTPAPDTARAAAPPAPGRTGRPAGRAILVGDADFVTDEFLQGNPDNLRFFLNGIDWLAQDEALIAIRSKDRTPPRLLFDSEFVRDAVKYGNLVGVPLLFVLFGMLRLARRRGLQRRTYGAAA